MAAVLPQRRVMTTDGQAQVVERRTFGPMLDCQRDWLSLVAVVDLADGWRHKVVLVAD